MNKKMPTGLVMVAAVIAVGMVGSQLNVGGLSGQAAGGDSAGCGGDAYYDEDLGQLVDGDGTVQGTDDTSSDNGIADMVNVGMRPIQAGEAIPGQEMVLMIEPSDGRLAELADASAGTAHFVPEVDIGPKGKFALIAWSPSEEGYEDMSYLQILEQRDGNWFFIAEWNVDRDQDTSLRVARILHVVGDEYIYISLNNRSMVYDIQNAGIGFGFPIEDTEELQTRGDSMIDTLLYDFPTRVRSGNDLEHDWANPLVEGLFEGELELDIETSLGNEIFVGVSAGAVLLVESCEVGAEPSMSGDTLMCQACSGTCVSPLNNVDYLALPFGARQQLFFADLMPQVQFLRQERRIARMQAQELRFQSQGFPEFISLETQQQEMMKSGTFTARELWDATQAAYSGASSSHAGWSRVQTCEVRLGGQVGNARAVVLQKRGVRVLSISGSDKGDLVSDGWDILWGRCDNNVGVDHDQYRERYISGWGWRGPRWSTRTVNSYDRGSGDWCDNVNTANRNGWHAGFQDYTDEWGGQYEGQGDIERLDGSCRDVLENINDRVMYVVGHSLGGASAMTVAKFHGFTGKVVTFGAPKTTHNGGETCGNGVGDSYGYGHVNDAVTGNLLGVMGSLHHAQVSGKNSNGSEGCGAHKLSSSNGSNVWSLISAIGSFMDEHVNYHHWVSTSQRH